jgi:hypothetical protein
MRVQSPKSKAQSRPPQRAVGVSPAVPEVGSRQGRTEHTLDRRQFIKRGALFLPAIFIPRLIRAQTILTANGLATFGTTAPAAGGGGGGSTSYANTGGTGNRTTIITVSGTALSGTASLLVDGSTTGTGVFITGVALNGTQTIIFDFLSGHSAVIDEAKFYQSTTAAQGTWKWQGSNDGSSWTDIGSSFAFGGVLTQTITALSGNTTAYRYYRMVSVSGTSNGVPWSFEFEFKITYT